MSPTPTPSSLCTGTSVDGKVVLAPIQIVLYVLVIITGYSVLVATIGYVVLSGINERKKRQIQEEQEDKLLAQKAKVMEQAGKVAASKNTPKQGAEFMRKSVLLRSSAVKGKDLERKKSFLEEVAEVGR